MFRKFLDFVKEEKQYDFESSEQFLKSMGGKTFLNGMYRIFDEKSKVHFHFIFLIGKMIGPNICRIAG